MRTPDAFPSKAIPYKIVHGATIAADVAATVDPNYPGIYGTIVGVQFHPGIHGGTTVVTDLDMTLKKNTTSLHAAVAAVDASTLATGAGLTVDRDTLLATATPANLEITPTDYLGILYDVTGGSAPTIIGAGATVWIVPHEKP